ncbi:MAG: hypothetical protein WA184_13565, partial [Stellaceae bacterium]
CELELVARMMDEPPVVVDAAVVAKASERMKTVLDSHTYGLMEWEGIVRTVDRNGPDYRR